MMFTFEQPYTGLGAGREGACTQAIALTGTSTTRDFLSHLKIKETQRHIKKMKLVVNKRSDRAG